MCRLTRMVCQNSGKFERVKKFSLITLCSKQFFFAHVLIVMCIFNSKKSNFFLRYGHFKSNLLLFA